ncbi:hypothetical protein NYG85_09925, partial [Campylobacter sp. PS10]|nr:hypothetical protein [Campylobacter gastrosuis]
GKELEHEISKAAKEHKLDIEYALLGLGRDSNVKLSVFKEPTARTKKWDINPLYIFMNLKLF